SSARQITLSRFCPAKGLAGLLWLELGTSVTRRRCGGTQRGSADMGPQARLVSLRRFDDYVGVLDRIAGADQPDGPWDALLEGEVGFKGERNAGKAVAELLLCGRVVVGEEFLRHPGAAD